MTQVVAARSAMARRRMADQVGDRPADAMFTTTVCRDRIVAHGDQWRWTPSGAGSCGVRLRRSRRRQR